MTFKEAFDICEKDNWSRYVLMNEDILGKDTFLTMSYHLKKESKGPVYGAIDTSQGKYLKMTVYLGGNNFKDDIEVPYKIVDPESEGWQPDIFIGDLSIGEFEVGGIKVSEQDGNIEIIEKEKLLKLVEKATKADFSLSNVNLDEITDINSYFN